MDEREQQESRELDLARLLYDSMEIEDLADVLGDLADIGLDRLLVDDLGDMWEEVPLVKGFIALVKASNRVYDVFLGRKLFRFLTQLKEIDPAERRAWITKQDDELGFTLIHLIHKLDSFSKPELVGRMIRAAILDQLPLERAMAAIHAVNRALDQDLHVFMTLGMDDNEDRCSRLYNSGILRVSFQGVGRSGLNIQRLNVEMVPQFDMSQIGEDLLTYGKV